MSSISSSILTKKTSVRASYINNFHPLPASVLEHAPLEAVYIYFDTATYDEIERDEKVKCQQKTKIYFLLSTLLMILVIVCR